MQDYFFLEATRWKITCSLANGNLSNQQISVVPPVTDDYILILRKSAQLFRYFWEVTSQAENAYDQDIETRLKTDGRLINLSMPVRYSSAITDIGSLISETEVEIDEKMAEIEQLAENASFDIDSVYEKKARESLNRIRKLRKFTELHLHTHLWMVWINESLSQASQVHHQVKKRDTYEDDSLFTYVAHPPLMVATMGCTAMIEEVGGHYLKEFTGKNINLDNTSCTNILNWLSEEYKRTSDYRMSDIDDVIVNTRNQLSHYLTERGTAVSTKNIEKYVELCQECVSLCGILMREMHDILLDGYRENIM